MEDEGVLAFDVLNQIGDLIGESVARVVQRTRYVPVVAPLLVPVMHNPSQQFIRKRNRKQ